MKKHKLGSGVGYGHRKMAVECLEGRSMLAGNVNVFVDGGGNLIVRGDNRDNGVLISQIARGRYEVTGYDFGSSSSPGTRINGSLNGTRTFSGVTGDINVDLKGANDALGVGNSAAALESLAEGCGFGIGLGSGSGSGPASGSSSPTGEGRLHVPRSLIVSTGDGNDGVAVIADVRRNVVIDTGSGNDGVAVGNLADEGTSDINIGDDLIILTGSGNDDVCVTFVTVRDHLNIQTGDGNDRLSALQFDAGHVLVIGGSGNDSVTLSQFDTDREVVVDTGGGADGAFLSNFSAGQGFGPRGQRGAGYITVVTGSGNDEAELTNFEASGVVVDTGSGNDGSPRGESPITVANATIRNNLTLVTGSGNDLVLVDNVAARTMVIDTGSGNDNATLSNSDIRGHAIIVMGCNDDFLLLLADSFDHLFACGGSGNNTFRSDLAITTNGLKGKLLISEFDRFRGGSTPGGGGSTPG